MAIKRFNAAGPCLPAENYMLPVLPRLPEEDIKEIIDGKYYFIIHAPRQSGKTTYLDFLTNKINSECEYYAINCSLMTLRNIEDEDKAMQNLIDLINDALSSSQVNILKQKAYKYNSLPGIQNSNTKVKIILNNLCEDLDKDLIVFFDEADCPTGQALLTFLGQIRDAYQIRHNKGNKFPRSMALVGMRDVRDYLSQVRPDSASMGVASLFNIKKDAFTLPNFTRSEIGTLYRQHTKASGQVFLDSAIDRAWHWSEGQPWLVNALAYESVVKILRNDYSATIDGKLMDQAAEALIKRRDAHIDSLWERLKETRVARVMDSVFASTVSEVPVDSDDRKYCVDLGLVVPVENGNLRPANALYQEILSRAILDPI
ncbi:MAG: AAA-like domain-containing protein [Deltaproteobacteria bacterium]|jgi:hypothetical protein|nr:AAA-like domain-containing protein [Deltaproteobacteria bacterium]